MSCAMLERTGPADRLRALLARSGGASLAELCEGSGWSQPVVRSALAAAMRRERCGVTVRSHRVHGVRLYHLTPELEP